MAPTISLKQVSKQAHSLFSVSDRAEWTTLRPFFWRNDRQAISRLFGEFDSSHLSSFPRSFAAIHSAMNSHATANPVIVPIMKLKMRIPELNSEYIE